MIGIEWNKFNGYSFFPRCSIETTKKRFINTDNGEQVGTQWNRFHKRDNKSYYFESFGGSPDKFSLQQIPIPLFFHNYKLQI